MDDTCWICLPKQIHRLILMFDAFVCYISSYKMMYNVIKVVNYEYIFINYLGIENSHFFARVLTISVFLYIISNCRVAHILPCISFEYLMVSLKVIKSYHSSLAIFEYLMVSLKVIKSYHSNLAIFEYLIVSLKVIKSYHSNLAIFEYLMVSLKVIKSYHSNLAIFEYLMVSLKVIKSYHSNLAIFDQGVHS